MDFQPFTAVEMIPREHVTMMEVLCTPSIGGGGKLTGYLDSDTYDIDGKMY
jgi:hypothetical protein